MVFYQLNYSAYQIKYPTPIVVRGKRLTTRHGFYISLTPLNDKNRLLHGEVAPLENFSIETYAQAKQELERLKKVFSDVAFPVPDLPKQVLSPTSHLIKKHLLSYLCAMCQQIDKQTSIPSVQWGLSMCFLNALFLSLPKEMTDKFFNNEAKSSKLLSVRLKWRQPFFDDVKLSTAMRSHLQTGITHFKLKLGSLSVKQAFNQTKFILQLLYLSQDKEANLSKQKYGLRLDCNAQWHKNKTIAFLHLLYKKLPANMLTLIDYLEEPLLPKQLSSLPELNKHSLKENSCHTIGVPIALDENFTDDNYHLYGKFIDVVVAKPMYIGSLINLTALWQQLYARKKRLVISSLYETEIGGKALTKLITLLDLQEEIHGLSALTPY